MKIAVIGYSGAGKSTLAKHLSKKLGIPLLYLDTIRFKPNWTERETEECIEIVADWMDERDSWVIDGNYRSILQQRRFDEADYIVFLDFPMLTCLKRVKQRYKKYKGMSRESMTIGCEEKLDKDFLKWVTRDCRNRYAKAAYKRTANRYPDKFIRCRSDKEVEAFVSRFD